MEVMERRFDSWSGYLELGARHDPEFEYSVAWIDGLARGRDAGRGIYEAGNHAATSTARTPRSSWIVPSARGEAAPLSVAA